jgi:hypothetical protein
MKRLAVLITLLLALAGVSQAQESVYCHKNEPYTICELSDGAVNVTSAIDGNYSSDWFTRKQWVDYGCKLYEAKAADCMPSSKTPITPGPAPQNKKDCQMASGDGWKWKNNACTRKEKRH